MLLAAGHNWQYGLGVGRWSGALAAIALLHVGAGLAALMVWETYVPPAPPAAAIVVELALAPAAPPSPQVAAPQEAETAPEPEPEPAVEPEPVVEPEPTVTAALPEPLPIPEAAPALPEPEVVLPTPEKPKKKPEEPKPAEKPQKPVEKPKPKPAEKPKPVIEDETTLPPQPAQQQAAVPAAPAAPAPMPAAPSAADVARMSAAKASWEGLLLAHLEKHKRYPLSAQRRNVQGTAFLDFAMDRNGKVLRYALVISSGSEVLDEEVLEMIQRAQPLPALPAELPDATAEYTVPINFNLH